MKRLLAFIPAIGFAVLGNAMSSGNVPPAVIVALGLLMGAALGALCAFGSVADDVSWVRVSGVLLILVVGGVAVFAPAAVARSFAPSALLGALVGGVAFMLFLHVPSEGDDDLDI